jgi:hypothetical protein
MLSDSEQNHSIPIRSMESAPREARADLSRSRRLHAGALTPAPARDLPARAEADACLMGHSCSLCWGSGAKADWSILREFIDHMFSLSKPCLNKQSEINLIGSPRLQPIKDVIGHRAKCAGGESAPQNRQQKHCICTLHEVFVDWMGHDRPLYESPPTRCVDLGPVAERRQGSSGTAGLRLARGSTRRLCVLYAKNRMQGAKF